MRKAHLAKDDGFGGVVADGGGVIRSGPQVSYGPGFACRRNRLNEPGDGDPGSEQWTLGVRERAREDPISIS